MSRFLAFQAADFGDACCTADGPEGRGGPPALIVDSIGQRFGDRKFYL